MSRFDEHVGRAEMRLQRAISTVGGELLGQRRGDLQSFEDSVSRIIIFTNTVAEALADLDNNAEAAKAADLLWKLGEGLGIQVDGAR